MSLKEVLELAEHDSLLGSHAGAAILFGAEWHEASKPGGQMDGVLSALAMKFPNIKIYRTDTEKAMDIAEKYGINAVPTTIMIHNRKQYARVEGANPSEIIKKMKDLNAHLQAAPAATSATATESQTTPKTEEELNNRLRGLVNSSPVMLFMKGTPEGPRCGFSRQIVEILRTEKVPFTSFDILTDESVRAGLKTLYDWPTYPQLYAKGELMGGLDIVKEMVASGESLSSQLGIDGLVQPPPVPTLEDKLKALISKAPVMLFMKGSPTEPRCGFSKTIVSILNEQTIKFSTFDILTDEEVRAGLKTYSDWPTYPQLYVNGEFAGGLDIVKEMVSAGDLKSQLGI
jgi:Grx4 family monothiol glutaredoxin